MKIPWPTVDFRRMVTDLGESSRKAIASIEAFTGIQEVDVGTAPMDLVYTEDKLNLYHYRQNREITCRVPVLIVYALVNRQYMLDLQPDRSIVRNLLAHGMDLYLIDWGYPTKADMYLSVDDYVNGYLRNCAEEVKGHSGVDKITLMGICQGGTFSAMYAALYPEELQNLITIVAPFDFSTDDGLLFAWSRHMNADDLVDTYRVVPGDFLNIAYTMLMPFALNVRKYRDMLNIVEDREKLLNFLRMEKWIFDSPGQAGECLREFIKDFYQENKLVKGEIEIGGRRVDLKNITMPLLNIYASLDHIVPPAATKPLNDLVGSTDKTLYEFQGGHVGIFVSSKSQKVLAPFIAKWLHDRQNGRPAVRGERTPQLPAGRQRTVPPPKAPARAKGKVKEVRASAPRPLPERVR